jgi:hypothetical protein
LTAALTIYETFREKLHQFAENRGQTMFIDEVMTLTGKAIAI